MRIIWDMQKKKILGSKANIVRAELLSAGLRKVADNIRKWHSFTEKGNSQFAGGYYPCCK